MVNETPRDLGRHTHGAEVDVVQHNSRRFQNEIMANGKTSQMRMHFVMLCT